MKRGKEMNRKSYLALCITVAMLLCGACSNTANKAIEQGKLAIANSEYKNALNSLVLAKDEGAKGNELDTMISILDNYLDSLNYYENGDVENALASFSLIPSEYCEYTLKDDVDALKSLINASVASSQSIDEQIEGLKTLIAAGDYTGAEININELYQKELSLEQENQVNELNATLRTAQSKINAATKVVYVTPAPVLSTNTVVTDTYYVVNCNEWISLRTSPSTSASRIASIPLGSSVGFIEVAGNGFYKINYQGNVGYALASYLSPRKQSNMQRTATVINCNEWITLRSEPSTSAASLDKIPLGATVTYLDTATSDFYKISYNGKTGYALKSYLRLN